MQTLILTARIDPANQAFFDELRELHFPKEKNYLKAHLTLFHQLADVAETYDTLRSINQQPFNALVSEIKLIGFGVAYFIQSSELINLHHKLKSNFKSQLSKQDEQPLRPHITIQNKAQPEQVKCLLKELTPNFKPFSLSITGLDLWYYLNGPWQHVNYFPF